MTPPTIVDDLRSHLDRAASPEPGDDTRLDGLLAAPAGAARGPALDHDAVRAADPLDLDAVFADLPVVNRAGDVATLTGWVAGVIDRGDPGWSVTEATAALRDAGMLAASLRRAGIEPSTAVPALEPLLLAWADRTGMVPRDTVVHYGLWNPPGGRERRFVDDGPQEGALIQSVRFSCRVLPLAGAALDVAWRHGVTSPTALDALGVTRDAVTAFAGEFTRVRGIVDPHFFIERLRPYFDPFTVAGTAYNGPAAAFIPLYLVDELLWGGGPELSVVHHEALRYGRPEWRAAFERVAARGSVAAWLEDREPSEHTPQLRSALDITDAAVHALLRFRGQHVTTARQAYSSGGGHYDHGSGGFAPDDLRHVVDEERAAGTVLHAAERHARDAR